MKNCEHAIGMMFDYDNTDLISLADLKLHVEFLRKEKEYQDSKEFGWKVTAFTLSDYADRRKSTDIRRFNYCPFCGAKIDWKAIGKEGDKS